MGEPSLTAYRAAFVAAAALAATGALLAVAGAGPDAAATMRPKQVAEAGGGTKGWRRIRGTALTPPRCGAAPLSHRLGEESSTLI